MENPTRADITLSVCDSSDLPVVCNPHISRLLAAFGRVHYKHLLKPNLVRQRFLAVENLEDDLVIWCDDDIIPTNNWLTCYEEHHRSPQETFVQGVKVDLFNDRGYPDFRRHDGIGDEPTCHSYRFFESQEEPLDHSKHYGAYCPDSGLFMMRANEYKEMYRKLHLRTIETLEGNETSPGVFDDAMAEYARQNLPYILDHRLCGDHVGNSNNHWSASAHKRDAIRHFLEGVSK